MKFLYALLLIPFLVIPAYGESQTLPTEDNTLDVKITHDTIEPNTQSKIKIDFINPQTQKIQVHVDYAVTVSKDGEIVFGPTQLIHTSEGSVKIPIQFNLGEGMYSLGIEIQGILFNPIPKETVSFDIKVGDVQVVSQPNLEESEPPQDNGGGCLIATATYGSEMATEVQQLREIRDNQLLNTKSGKSFVNSFNDVYYSFSPIVADYERENPVFREAVKLAITPMISTLSIMSYAESDSEVVSLGVGVILLNLGMYLGVPMFGIFKLNKLRKN